MQLEVAGQTASPTGAQLLQAQSIAIWRQGRFAEGEALIAECLKEMKDLSPGKPFPMADIYKDLGKLYFSWGKLDEAVQAWETAVKEETRFRHRRSDASLLFAERRLLQLKLLAGHDTQRDWAECGRAGNCRQGGRYRTLTACISRRCGR